MDSERAPTVELAPSGAAGAAPARPREGAQPAGIRTRPVAFWKAMEYAGLIAFTILAPRLMGPEGYGRFAALLSLVGLLTMASALGAQATLGRFVPEYELRGEREQTRALFTRIFLVRAAAGTALGAFFLILFPRLSPETPVLAVLFGAATILVAALGSSCFQLFYGMNSLGRWSTRDGLARLLLLGLLVAIGGTVYTERAALSMLLAEVVLLVIGVAWARSFFTTRWRVRDDSSVFVSQVRFGLVLFLSNFVLMAVWRGGETVLLFFSAPPAEIAFYSIASGITLALSALIGQVAAIITPSVTAFHLAGEMGRRDFWLGHSLKWLTIACFAVLFLVYSLLPAAVESVLGKGYGAVIDNLRVLSLALLPAAFIRTGISLSVVQTQPGKALQVAAYGLATFAVAGAVLVPFFHSVGASWAVVVAVLAASVATQLHFSLQPLLVVARFWRLLALGSLAFALCFLPLEARVAGSLGMLTFVALLFAGGVLTPQEVRRMAHAVSR